MSKIDKFFKLQENNTDFKTEVLAGFATFLTMAYIIFVNPNILVNQAGTGMSFSGVVTATVLVSAFSSIFMGLYANLPFALAPGMGLNAFFAFTLVKFGGVSWETALGAVFIAGVIFIILSLLKIREEIVNAIPLAVRYGVAAGIGLFLAFIGLKSAGFIVSNPATFVSFGGMNPQTLVFVFGLLLTSVLVVKKVKGNLVIGIIVTAILAIIVNKVLVLEGAKAFAFMPKEFISTPCFDVFFKLDIKSALSIGMVLPVFTLLFTDMFDSISTFVGVSEVGGFIDSKTGQPKNVGKALLVDAVSTTISGLFGTSSGTTYIESAAGVEEGGRTGLTAVVTGLLFLPFMFFAPLVGVIPAVATAPVLVIIGVFMMQPLSKLKWTVYEDAIPAFLALILIPLTYSITTGIVWGFLSFTVIKLLIGKVKEIPVTLWIINIFCIVSLIVSS
jgi:AGZA family xanthine/uracil permease-like MFS transporter